MGTAYENFLEREVERLKADLAQESKTRILVMAERDRLRVLVARAQGLLKTGLEWQKEAAFEMSTVSDKQEADTHAMFYEAFGLTGKVV